MDRPLFIFNVMFVFGYYNECKLLRRQIISQFFLNKWINHFICHTINKRSMLMTLNIFSIFRFSFNFTEAIFHKNKIYSYGNYVVKKETKKGTFCIFLKKWAVLLFTHTSTAANQKIRIIQTVIMIYWIKTFFISTFKTNFHLIQSLLCKKR